DSAQTQLDAIEAVANAYQQDVDLPELPAGVDAGSFGLRRKFATGTAADAITANYQISGAKSLVAERQAEVNRLRNDLNVFDRDWRELISDDGSSGGGGASSNDKKGKKARQKTAEEL